jgi:hypothetical protein
MARQPEAIADSGARDRALSRLSPGAGRDSFDRLLSSVHPSARDHATYVFVSLIIEATRSRAAAQRRSTDLLGMFRASAVSSTVRPAK